MELSDLCSSPGKPVSVLFNEPKLLKSADQELLRLRNRRFSALQRAEIAEIDAERKVELEER